MTSAPETVLAESIKKKAGETFSAMQLVIGKIFANKFSYIVKSTVLPRYVGNPLSKLAQNLATEKFT